MKMLRNLLFVVLAFCNPYVYVNAGIPVLSPVELVQAVLEYTQVLADYEEQITLVQQGYEEHSQMIKDYEQALREYDHLLEMAQSYRDIWGSYNWDKFVNEMSNYFNNRHSYTSHDLAKLIDDHNYAKSRTLLMTKNGKVYTYQDAKDLINSIPFSGGKDDLSNNYDVLQNQYNNGVFRQQFYDETHDYVSSQVDRILDIEEKFSSLGDNSQLATSQYQAKLQLEAMQMQLQQIKLMNEMLTNQNQLNDLHNTKMLHAEISKIEKAKDAIDTQIVIDNRNKINF